MHNLTRYDVPLNPEHRRAWIIYQLRVRDSNLSAIADAEGVSQSAVSQSLVSPQYSRLDEAIAEKLGLEVEELYPERYDERGNRFFAVRSAKRSTPLDSSARRKASGE